MNVLDGDLTGTMFHGDHLSHYYTNWPDSSQTGPTFGYRGNSGEGELD